MAEELNENANSNNGEENLGELSPEDRELLGDLDPSNLTVEDFLAERREKLAIANKNKQLYARVSKPNSQPLKNNTVNSSPDRIEQIDLRSRGYNDDEISVIQKYGGIEALKDPIIMSGIENMRAQRAAEQATVDVGTGGGSDIERKYSPTQLKEMPLEDLEKILPKA